MTTVAQLEIQMQANVARIRSDMSAVRSSVTGTMQQVESRARQAMQVLSGFGVAFAGLEGIKAISHLSDDFTRLSGQLRIATTSQRAYEQSLARVSQIATTSQADIGAIATLYARISNAARDLNVSQEQVGKITETVSLALKAGGATTEEAASTMLQLSQAFGSGRLQGQEFNAVAEAAPNLLRALASAIGVPYGQLKNLAAQGVLTTDVMVRAFTNPKLMDSLKEQALQMQTVSGAVTVMKNNLIQAVGDFNTTTGASQKLSAVLGTLANNMDVVVRGGIAFTGVFAARKVLDMSASFVELTAKTIAQSRASAFARDAEMAEASARVANLRTTQEAIQISQAEAVAKLNAANASVASAQAQIRASQAVGTYSAALFSVRQAEVAATAATEARSVALAELAALGNQAASVQAKLAVATEAANLATAAGGTAASLAARAVGFLGGPIGIVTTALSLGATAWAIWGGKAEESEQKATGAVERSTQDIIAGLDKQIAKLKERNSLAAAGVNAKGAGDAAEERLAKIYKQIQEVQKQGTLDGQSIPNQSAKIAILASLGRQYGELSQRIKEVNTEQKKATDAQNLQSLDSWMQKHEQYATKEQKVAIEIAKAQKELGAAFTPELAKRIRDSIINPTKALTAAHKAETKAVEQRQKAYADFYASQQKGVDAEASTTKEIEKQVEQLREQTATMGMTEKETRRAELANIDFSISVIEMRKRLAENGFANRALVGQYDEQLQALHDLKQAKSEYYDKKVVVDNATATKAAYTKIFSDIETGLTNALINGFENGKGVLASIGDYIKNYFKSLVVRIAVQPVMSSVAGLMGLSYGQSASAADLSMLKSVGSAASSFASNPIAAISNGFSMLNGSLTTGLQDLYINTAKIFNGGQVGMSTVYNAGQFADLANGIGSAVGYLKAIDAGLNGKYMTAIGTGLGTFFGGPIGGFLGNVAGGFLDKVLGFNGGGGAKNEGGFYGSGAGGFTGNGVFNTQAKQIAQNTVDQYNQITKALGGQAQKLAVDLFIGSDPKGTANTQLAFGGSVGGQSVFSRSGFGFGYENVGRSEDALKQAVSEAALRTVIGALKKTDFADNIDALLGSVNLATTSFADLQKTIDQLNVLNYLNQNMMVFGSNVRTLANGSSDAFKAAIDAAGGTQQFTAALASYMNSFASSNQKLEAAQNSLSAQFASLNVSMPKTVDGFKALIDAQDLTTASGQSAYLALIGLTDQFKQFIDAQNQMQATLQAAEQKASAYLAQLTGTQSTLGTITGQISDLTAKLASTSDVSQRLAMEGQLSDLIMQRYQAEQDLFNQALSKINDLSSQISSARANVASSRATVLGYDPTVMTADQIRAGVANASALGQLPSTAGIDSASQLLAGLQSASGTQQALIESLTGQKGGLQQALDDATAAFSSYKASQLGAAQQGIDAASRLASQFGVWLNGNAGGTGNPFAIQNGQVMTDWQSIGYYTNNPGGPAGFRDKFYGDTSQVGGMTAFDAIYNANKRIADAQTNLSTISGQLANKTIELAQAQAKATDIQIQITEAEKTKAKAQEDFAGAIQNYVLDAQNAVTKLTSLREETVKYYQAQKALADLMGTSASGLRGTVSQVRYNDMNAVAQLQDLQNQFASAFGSAQSASGASLATYGDKLNGLIDPILQKAAEVYASGPQFQAIKEAVLGQAMTIADKLDQLAPKDYQSQSLSLLDTIDTTLATIQDNTMSANQLLVAAINDSKTATSKRLEAIIAAIQGEPIPAFANGGLFGGGARIVGERGPELELTGPSRIIPNNQLRAMAQPMDTRALEQKLDQIAMEGAAQVRVLQAGFQAVLNENVKMSEEITALRKKVQFEKA